MTTLPGAFITRHPVFLSHLTSEEREFEETLIHIKYTQLQSSIANLRQLIRAAVRAAGLAHALEPDCSAVAQHLRVAARATWLAALLAGPDPRPVALDLGLGPVLPLLPTPGQPLIDGEDLATGIYAALAARCRGPARPGRA